MSSSITNSAEFTAEQKEYLHGFFAGIERCGFTLPFVGHTAGGQITANPQSQVTNQAETEATWFDTPLSDLSREELWKYEQNPLDMWDKILEYSNQDRFPSDEDRFRLKYLGLFYVAPAQDSFMLRLRMPGGVLSAYQMRGLARIAERYGIGRADLTTRSNIQLRGFAPRHIVSVLQEIQALGLTSKGTGADNIRNITASPISGLDPLELIDVSPLAQAMQSYISNTSAMYDLPRKFNIAFDNGGTISTLADTNDIGFLAVRITEGHSIPAGVYFRVMLCGITGHRQFASDCGLLIRPEETVAVAAAMIRVFVKNGDRTNRKKARLKYLIDQWGVERFLEETQKVLAFPLIRVPLSECEPRKVIDRQAHLGVHQQSQPGLSYLGISIPVGQLGTDKMLSIAAIAERFGTGELRLTVWQNLIIPHIAQNNLDGALTALHQAGLSDTAGTVLSGTVACTGNKGCRFAAADTKSHAVALATHLDDLFPMIDQPINLHVTGCSHSCAQHYIGDIGLMGVKVGGEEGYQVVIGGGSDSDQGVARELIQSVRFTDLATRLDGLFRAYTMQHTPNESLLEFTRRHDITTLQQFCNQEQM